MLLIFLILSDLSLVPSLRTISNQIFFPLEKLGQMIQSQGFNAL